jgi:HTH-type transcriptional regulator/antitoxin HigA
VQPAEAFPLGQYLREELEARGWSEADFARYSRSSEARIQAILSGDQPCPCEEAEMAGALGCSAELLRNLDEAYRQWRERQ